MEILPPGSFTTIQTKSEKPGYKTHQYWDYIFQTTNQEINKADLVEEGRHLFDTSVQRQLVSDVEVGSYLSGGMDSGSIVSIASRFNRNLKTFTCGFDVTSASGIERGFDERVAAEALSAEFKTEHYEVVLKSGDMERCIEEFAYHLEEREWVNHTQIFMLLNLRQSLSKSYYQVREVMNYLVVTLGDITKIFRLVPLRVCVKLL